MDKSDRNVKRQRLGQIFRNREAQVDVLSRRSSNERLAVDHQLELTNVEIDGLLASLFPADHTKRVSGETSLTQMQTQLEAAEARWRELVKYKTVLNFLGV